MVQPKMEFTRDEFGKEVLLKEGKYQVMMEWERPYMQACIDALEPRGDVLEIGFGCGYASDAIQSWKPKSHTIIECDPVVLGRAHEWAQGKNGVRIVAGTWQSQLASLGQFDTIFFDDYPIPSDTDAAVSNALIEQGKAVLNQAREVVPDLDTRKYESQDVEEFLSLVSGAKREELVPFLDQLLAAGQIDQVTHDGVVSRLGGPVQRVIEPRGDRLFEFFFQCFPGHMRVGARFGCYIESPVSKLQDAKFAPIVNHQDLHYHEKWISVDVPKNCSYYNGDRALVICIERVR